MDSDMDLRTMSRKEVQDVLGVCDKTVRRMVADGRLRAFWLNPAKPREFRVFVSSLEALMSAVPAAKVRPPAPRLPKKGFLPVRLKGIHTR